MNKKLKKLVEHVNMLNLNCKEDSPEYLLLENILTDEMIDIGLSMKIRTPYTVETIAARSGMPVEKVKTLTAEMAYIGFLEYTKLDGKEALSLPVFAPGSMELMMMQPEQVAEHPEIAFSFITYVENLTKNFARFFPKGNGLVITLPIQKAISAEPKRIEIEEVSYWVDKYYPQLSVTCCQCRRAGRVTNNIGEDKEGKWCIQLGEFAESCIKTGRSRRVSKEEVYDILRRAEEMGYVHEVTNVDGPKNSLFICNCHPETCLAFRTARLIDTPNMMKSNFVASVDKDKCAACGQCVEVCPMNAAKLGQKLCQEHPVKIKANISPDDHPWGKDKWQLDFRNTKKDVVPETGTAPCKTYCPAHISVQGYIRLAAEGKYAEALELIKKDNPFPAVCGRICPRKCEGECTRGDLDAPVAIDEIKKFVAQQELMAEHRYIPKKKFHEGEKIAVIGAGPAGLSCAYYLALFGHSVTVYEKQRKLGGMLTMGIPAFRLEKDVVNAEIDILRQLGVAFRTGVEVGKDITIPQLRAQGYKGFYVAVGAQGGRALRVEGEDARGVISGVDFLRGVALDAPEKLSGNVVVIGGGNVAIDVARTAARCGGEAVDMFCLESAREMPALPEEIDEATGEGISINNGWGPKRFITENGRVTGVEFKRCVSVFNAQHRFEPKYDENDTKIVPADFVLVSVGQSISWGEMLAGAKVSFNKNGTAVADSVTYQTGEPDIFVGGDAFSGPKFAIDAIAAGKEGANSLHRFVLEGHDLLIGRDLRKYHAIDKENLALGGYDTTARQRPLTKVESAPSFEDNRMVFTEEQLKKETSRCLGCGLAVIDQTRCLGCGLCTTRCKFDAISLHKVSSEYGGTYEQLPLKIAGAVTKRAGRIAVRSVKDAFSKD